MSVSRKIVRERFRKRYTYSYTKATIAFVLSVVLSIIFSPFFERYGGVIAERMLRTMLGEDDSYAATNAASPASAPLQRANP